MKKVCLGFLGMVLPLMASAQCQGWPEKYEGVMLQGFYWDSFADSKWKTLEKQADVFSNYFSLVWIPQSGNCSGTSMGYNPKYYWDQNSSFGSEEQLRSLISTFKSKGIGTIADVVINHRQNLSNWCDFPAETYKGVTYEMVSTDICANDDGGATKTWADKNGYKLSSNNDSGEDWDGMRDLDHASANVQTIIKAYEDYLLNDLGYTGFRYDVGKGFAAKYFGLYNDAARPQFSVGEVWDGNQVIKNWINGTKSNCTTNYDAPQSAAFDFQFRYQVRDAVNGNDWTKVVGTNCLLADENFKRYSVTFVENHDTEYRSSTSQQDPIKRDTLAANAFMLAMPGTPCVFFKHWLDCKPEIKLMIEARKLAGIHNQSKYLTISQKNTCTVVKVTGTKGNLYVAVGKEAQKYTNDYTKELCSGYHYKYLVDSDFDTSGWQTVVDRVKAETKAEEQQTEDYDTPESGYTFTAYFLAPTSWKNTIMCWAWTDNGPCYTGTDWPGVDCYKIGKTYDGRYVWQWCYYGTLTDAPGKIIFNNSGSPQTADMIFTDKGWYQEKSTKSEPDLEKEVGIGEIEFTSTPSTAANCIYNLNGQRVGNASKGIVIINGKKVIR